MTNFVRKFLDLFGSSREQSKIASKNLKVGGLYSVIHDADEGTFGIVKILVLESSAVHLCIYANTFASRPTSIDLSTLSMGGIDLDNLDDDAELDMSGCGIGHLPLSLKDFVYGWQPLFLAKSVITDDDLVGYNIWKEGGGGIFDSFR